MEQLNRLSPPPAETKFSLNQVDPDIRKLIGDRQVGDFKQVDPFWTVDGTVLSFDAASGSAVVRAPELDADVRLQATWFGPDWTHHPGDKLQLVSVEGVWTLAPHVLVESSGAERFYYVENVDGSRREIARTLSDGSDRRTASA